MNSRLITAIVLVITALFTGIFAFSFISEASAELTGLIEKAEEKVYKGEDCSRELLSVSEGWKKYSRPFAVILKHSDADVLDRYFMMLEEAYKKGDTGYFLQLSGELKVYLRSTVKGEAPVAENIF